MIREHEDYEVMILRRTAGVLDLEASVVLDEHLETCPGCQGVADQERRLSALLQVSPADPEDGVRLRSSIDRSLEGTRRQNLALLFGLIAVLGLSLFQVLVFPDSPTFGNSWTLLLSIAGGFAGGLLWNIAKRHRLCRVASAAQNSQDGYQALEQRRLGITITEHRIAGWFSLAVTVFLPVSLLSIRLYSEQRGVVVKDGDAWIVLSIVCLFLALFGVFLLRKTRRLQLSAAQRA